MKSNTILVALLLFIGLTTAPITIHADTSAQAFQINDTNVMFLIDFQMTADKSDQSVPIIASSRVAYNDRVDVVGYSLKSSDTTTPSISAVSGFVLSTATIALNNRYIIKASTTESFRLAIFATFEKPMTSHVAATITKLPYWINDRRTTVHQNQLADLDTATLIAQ